MGHTPGPWRIGLEDGDFVDIDAPTHHGLATVVVKMDEDAKKSPQLIANASLIAAAPFLLECLKTIANEPIGEAEATCRQVLSDIVDMARAAVDMATAH